MKLFGILANPAGHSLSPLLHNELLQYYEIDGKYERFEIAPEDLGNFAEQYLHTGKLSGLSVSLPFKESLMHYMTSNDDKALEIGAINTVVFENSHDCYGFNTDYLGLTDSLLAEFSSLESLPIIILGAGGAARAAIYGLLQQKANVIGVFNRDPIRAKTLINDMNFLFNRELVYFSYQDLEQIGHLPKGTLIIQATSIWNIDKNASFEAICPLNILQQSSAIMDLIYNPLKTPLLEMAESIGKKIITGEKMFLHQAARQFLLWTKINPDIDFMSQIFSSIAKKSFS